MSYFGLNASLHLLLQGLLGLVSFMLLAFALSESRHAVKWRQAFLGILLQVFLAILLTRISTISNGVVIISDGIGKLKEATLSGTSFVFGYIGGGELPFQLKQGVSTFSFAFQALPMILVISALSMLLFYWRILPWVVKVFSWMFERTLNIGGALGVAAAAKIFIGQSDAPLLIRPYLSKLTKSELFTVIVCGMATTSGTIMVVYSLILENVIPHALGHILTVSIISIPAAITLARIIIPHHGKKTSGELKEPYAFTSSMDAISRGTTDGLQMYLNILAMVLVTLALVKLVNIILGAFPSIMGHTLSLELIFGTLMAPVAWLMGIPWSEVHVAGDLLATKVVLNEVVAFLKLSKIAPGTLNPRTSLIMTYALCGFANFSSIGIVIGTYSTLVPERRQEVIGLGLKAVIAGSLSTCMSGTVIGLLS